MYILSTGLFGLYVLLMLFVLLYGLSQMQLLLRFWRYRSKIEAPEKPPKMPDTQADYPRLTIQLPIYNEYHVVEELLASITALCYPREQLEIQVLDDSTDETAALLKELVAAYKAEGFDIVYLHRTERRGYKAGALAEALAQAKGEYLALFDADFRPEPDFLLQALPYLLADEHLALVQSRWQHINKYSSAFSRLQALVLDAHFVIEQTSRYHSGYFMHFNGTAGIWRRRAIEEAGGWSSDSLTEDLDLSYRAQLAGWKLRFLPWLQAPSELPLSMAAIKSQQFRWSKGPAQCWRKNLGAVLRSELPLGVKFHAFFHLSNSGVFLAVWIISLLSLPLVAAFGLGHIPQSWGLLILLFNINSPFLFVFFFVAQYYSKVKPWRLVQVLPDFLFFLAVFLGLGFHNGWAAFEGYIGKESAFVRTPKFNARKPVFKGNKYLKKTKFPWGEFAMILLSLGGLFAASHYAFYGFFLFHLLLFLGYSIVAFAQLASPKS